MWTLILILQVVHLLYHQITSQFNFFPFNNIRSYTIKERLLEVFVNGIFMGFPILATLMGNTKMLEISCWILGSILFMEFMTWWKPYFFGASVKWQATYDKIFAPTIKVLPPIKNNPIPNLEHCILHTITLVTFVFTLIYYLQFSHQ